MLVGVSKLTKSYAGNVVFEDVNFIINEGDRIALIGENGSGKSTLFKIIADGVPCDQGQVTITKGISMGYLPQEPNVPDQTSMYVFAASAFPRLVKIEQTLRELENKMASPDINNDPDQMERVLSQYSRCQEQFEREGGYTIEAKVKAVLSGLGFNETQFAQPVGTLSGGEKKLVGLAKVLVQEPDLILLDEPDNHLDLEAKQWLHDYILAHKGAVAIISHDRYFLDQFINHILELEDRRIYEYHGNYTASREEKQLRLIKNEEMYRLRQRELVELEKSAKQLQEWAALNRKLAGRARNRKRMVEQQKKELEETPVPIIDRKTIQVKFDTKRSGQAALILNTVSMAIGERTLFEPFHLTVKLGERVGLVGPNGSGKTTLFKIIMGLVQPTTGEVKLGSNVNIGYYSQEQETLDPNVTPIDFIRSIKPMYEDQAIALLIKQLLFDYQDCFNKIGNLSGGEKSRLQITRLALKGANLLLLDEPTNNLDIPSMEVLESALEDFDGTILAISHDRYFLDRIVDRIVAIEDNQINVYPGDFSYYYAKTGRVLDF
jgi:ATP-binding cassette subfamily F protein 3